MSPRVRVASSYPPPAARPSAAEALAGLAAVRRCPYRSNHPPCGCSGARCALRGGAIVSHLDCFSCLRTYDPPPEP